MKRLLTITIITVTVAAAIIFNYKNLPTAQVGGTKIATQTETYGKLPLTFERNNGQTDAQVKFLSRGSGYALYLTEQEAVLRLQNGDCRAGEIDKSKTPCRETSSVLRMSFANANPQPTISGANEMTGKSNYLNLDGTGMNLTNVPNFERVNYREIYRGIDLVFYGNERQLEYDFNIAPHSDASQIKLNFDGAENLSIDGEGNLVAKISGGKDAQFNAPIAYQIVNGERREVESRYAIENNSIKFQIGDYDVCSYSISPVSQNFTVSGGSGSFNVIAPAGCEWTTVHGYGRWYGITGGQTGIGNGTVSFIVNANPTTESLTGTITVEGVVFTITQNGIAAFNHKPFDFDGDGKSDISIFRPSNGQWWYQKSSNGGNAAIAFGSATDKLVPGDYTGDGKTDIAFFRPASGQWFILRSEDNSFFSFPFGSPGDIPAPGDFDNDGKTDAAVFRPSTGTWFIQRSSDNQTTVVPFGTMEDRPVVADYDGDGKDDVAIFRPSNGQWWLNRSTAGVVVLTFGTSSDKTIQGDYTGDGKADVGFWRPSTGEWFILRSEDFSFFSFPFGSTGDIPVIGDYDGDGKFDAGICRPSNNLWFINRSTDGLLVVGFGLTGDNPTPGAYVR